MYLGISVVHGRELWSKYRLLVSGFQFSALLLLFFLEMEVDSVNPSELNSFLINEIKSPDVIDLKKKRKLQAEHLGLPIAKLKCSEGSIISEVLSTLDEIPEAESMQTNITKGGATDDGLELESSNSNSYREDSDVTMSVHGESKFQGEKEKSWSFDRPSSSSLITWASSSFNGHGYSSDTVAAAEGDPRQKQFTVVGEKCHASHHVDDLEDHLIEYEGQAEYFCSGGGEDIRGSFSEEREETMSSNEGSPNVYVLSSGRYSVNQETQCGDRKPTIDQEFEQYFSSLML